MKTDGNETINMEEFNATPHYNSRMMGLTKREYFASLALQGLAHQSNGYNFREKAVYAILLADTLIEELNKEKTNG